MWSGIEGLGKEWEMEMVSGGDGGRLREIEGRGEKRREREWDVEWDRGIGEGVGDGDGEWG